MELLRDQSSQLFYRDEHLFVDLRAQLVVLDSQTLSLTRKQYHLLVVLVQHVGEVVPRGILLRIIWGYGPQSRTRTLDAHIGQLRRKLGNEGRRIDTIVGRGYRCRPVPWLPLSQRPAS